MTLAGADCDARRCLCSAARALHLALSRRPPCLSSPGYLSHPFVRAPRYPAFSLARGFIRRGLSLAPRLTVCRIRRSNACSSLSHRRAFSLFRRLGHLLPRSSLCLSSGRGQFGSPRSLDYGLLFFFWKPRWKFGLGSPGSRWENSLFRGSIRRGVSVWAGKCCGFNLCDLSRPGECDACMHWSTGLSLAHRLRMCIQDVRFNWKRRNVR